MSTALDAKYTQELNDAKLQIDGLRDDVATGRRRLQLHAQCVSAASTKTATASMDNAVTARLDDAAERDYFILTERVTTMQKQREGHCNGLGSYVDKLLMNDVTYINLLKIR